jgi:hypothetical protein
VPYPIGEVSATYENGCGEVLDEGTTSSCRPRGVMIDVIDTNMAIARPKFTATTTDLRTYELEEESERRIVGHHEE